MRSNASVIEICKTLQLDYSHNKNVQLSYFNSYGDDSSENVTIMQIVKILLSYSRSPSGKHSIDNAVRAARIYDIIILEIRVRSENPPTAIS